MLKPKLFVVKSFIALLAIHSVAAAADSAVGQQVLKRRTISLITAGKEPTDIILPLGVSTDVKWTAQKTEFLPDGTVHVIGHVQLLLVLDKLPPISFLGDEMTLRSEELGAELSEAIKDLEKMGASDALFRSNPSMMTASDVAQQLAIDVANMKRLEVIINRFGWPGNRFAGIENAKHAFLVLQHADKVSQHKYLPLLRAAVAKGEADGADLALLEDRVLVSDGKPQLFGTQFKSANPMVLFPVFDEANLERRRSERGLPPMKEYLKFMIEIYKGRSQEPSATPG